MEDHGCTHVCATLAVRRPRSHHVINRTYHEWKELFLQIAQVNTMKWKENSATRMD